MTTHSCKQCGKTFIASARATRAYYCSTACKQRAYRANKKQQAASREAMLTFEQHEKVVALTLFINTHDIGYALVNECLKMVKAAQRDVLLDAFLNVSIDAANKAAANRRTKESSLTWGLSESDQSS